VGDFNMEEEELEMVVMERFLQGRWVRPKHPVPGGHRAIDLVMVSDVLEAGATVGWDEEGPWAAQHSGMVVSINLEVCAQGTRILRTPPVVEAALGPDRPWEEHQLHGRMVAEEGARRLEEAIGCDPPHHRDREADRLYMEFAGAAEHLLLQRQGEDANAAGPMRRGWPLQVRTVPLQPTRPQGWFGRPSGLSQWVALKAQVLNYIGALGRKRLEQAQRHWHGVEALIERVRQQPRILAGPDKELEVEMLNSIAAMGADAAAQDRISRLGPFVRKLENHLLRDSHRRFREWIVNSLKIGGGALHRYTSATSKTCSSF
jgi:hypothetical protein